MKSSPCRSSLGKGGFSLLEVLVASAVLSVVLVILLGTLSASMSLWRNTENKLIADREGRAAQLLLSQDLGSAVMPANPALWPRIVNGRLQFLAAKPFDYQDASAGDVGDVCLVEYAVEGDSHLLRRSFLGSRQTFEALKSAGNTLPAPSMAGAEPLATNVLVNMYDAVRGLKVWREPLRKEFVILNPEMMPITPPYNATNYPAAVEVNIGVADPEAVANEDLLSDPNYKLRNAGLYSFRISLPKPAR